MASINIQQLPKDPNFLECFTSKLGHSLIYSDFSNLEPTVLTEFSQDKRLLDIYGEGAAPNSMYLYFGAYTTVFGPTVRKYYNPDAPTKEMVDSAKRQLKEEYPVLKIVSLGLGYGMGAKKLKEDVNIAGFKLSFKEAKQIVQDYKIFFVGIQKFEQKLLDLYGKNGGYIVNGRGRILTVNPDYARDIVNKFVQSTGHDILMYYLLLLNRLRVKYNIPMRPWLVDEHDATIWEAPDAAVEQVVWAFKEAYKQLNETLKWGITFKGKIETGKTLAIKCD